MRAFALVAVLLWGCSHREAPVSTDKLTGTLVLDGAPVALVECQPAHAVHTYVVVRTDRGALKFEDQQLSWSGEPLTCAKLDRSWGGGNRTDGSSYWRGMLDFDCTGKAGHLVGRLDLDCGHITPAERAELDRNRAEQQRR